MTDETSKQIVRWIFTGETGLSSKCIAATMLGHKSMYGDHPSDPADFRRCLKLINIAPGIRDRLDEMRNISRYWNALIERWDEIEKCFMDEVPEWLSGDDRYSGAPNTFTIMQEVLSNAKSIR